MPKHHILPGDDPVLEEIITKFGFPVLQIRQPGFAAMVHIILEQQVSISSARACYNKLAGALADMSPDAVLQADPDLFRLCGISRQKAGYIINMAEMLHDGSLDFEKITQAAPEEARQSLLKIKGVGNWSAEVYLMFCLQSPDIIPLGDIAIQSAIRELYGLQTVAEMSVFSETWKPHRTVASYILWQHYLGKRKRL